jgi:DNA-binding transcriptional ArsR family regulator
MQGGGWVKAKTGRSGQGGKTIEERVGYALSHRMRVEILVLLNEAVYTADDIAALTGESRQNVHHHLRELVGARSIEIAKVEKRRNADLHYYRAVETPEYDEKAIAALSVGDRQDVAGLVLQHATAEMMAALAAGMLSNDPKVWLTWDWFHLDMKGRQDLLDEERRFWNRVIEIEVESTNRRADSGEASKPYVVASFGFQRARSAPVPPTADAD